jgi:hypothetical protein
MRWIVSIAIAMVLLGWIASEIEVVNASAQQPRTDDGWRRTTGGWERLVTTQKVTTSGSNFHFWQAHPHPFVATLLVLMLSLMLLVAFADGERGQRQEMLRC